MSSAYDLFLSPHYRTGVAVVFCRPKDLKVFRGHFREFGRNLFTGLLKDIYNLCHKTSVMMKIKPKNKQAAMYCMAGNPLGFRF